MSKTDVKQWLEARAEAAQCVQCDSNGLYFSHQDANCIDLQYPPKLERLPFFARLLSTLTYQPAHFQGALLWVTTWGVWNSMDEAPGYRLIETMHRAAGQPASFEAAPGHRFRADELVDATSMLLQPMIFGWDAYYVPTWSFGADEFFVHISHDSFASVVTRSNEFFDQAFALLKETGLNPAIAPTSRKERFCRS